MINEIYKEFRTGDRLTTKDVKLKLIKIYKENNIDKIARATDIKDYFITQNVKIKIKDKLKNGFVLIEYKSNFL